MAALFFFFGCVISFLLTSLFFYKKRGGEAVLVAVIEEKGRQIAAFEEKIESLQVHNTELAEERASLQTLLDTEKVKLQEVQEKFSVEFENLSNKILKTNSKEFAESSQVKIEELLSPLKEKMDRFQTSMQEIYKAGTAERLTLKNKIESIAGFSQALADETGKLRSALKGDVKKQGVWGELILQKVLEASGLREDQEYTLQGVGLKLSDTEGKRMQPDVVVNLPYSKRLIIDSKMSYTHYDDYFNAESLEGKQDSLKKLVTSIKDHMKGLSEKNYQFIENLESPDLVLMFIPIESVFSLALEADPGLFEEAWKRSIIIVSPANLLAILRTIESLWKVERQSRNTQRIADEGAALYDKFVDFMKDLENVGKHLKNTSEHFEKSMQKLSYGRGNLVKKVESLKKLGLKTKKQLPEEYLEEVEIKVDTF
jgi:DNA recombination protein RmuC